MDGRVARRGRVLVSAFSTLALVSGVLAGGTVSAAGTVDGAGGTGSGAALLYNPLAEDQWFVDQRLGGAKVIPAGTYARAVQQARALPVLPPLITGAPLPALAPGALARWTNLGPSPLRNESVSPQGASGRVSSIAISPSGTIFLGSAGGGAWSSTNDGASWTPLTDNQPSLAMGDVAGAPSETSSTRGRASTTIPPTPFTGRASSGPATAAEPGPTWA